MRYLIFFCFSLFLFSKETITLDFLKSKPEGIARDFYIWRYLQDPKTNLQEAIEAYNLVFKKNTKIEKLLAQKGYIHELPKDVRCKQLTFEKLKNEDGECIAFGLKLSLIPSLSSKDVQTLIQKLTPNDPILAQEVKILSSKHILKNALESKNAQIFSEIFYGLNLDQRLDFLNKKINPLQMQVLGNQNYPDFNKMLQYILLSNRFKHLKNAILESNITQADEKILLLIGISLLQEGKKKQAEEYFSLTFKEAKSPLIKDKALFWQYKASKNQKFLEQLAQSTQLNLYTIYANQTLKTQPKYTIVSKLENLKKGEVSLNISNPFEWQILKSNLIKVPTGEELKPILDKYLSYYTTEPHMAFFLNRIKKFRNNYFLMPYSNLLTWSNPHQKALTYAIAKQESNLLPALVSSSYALGMMQIMPFNLKPIAKSLGKTNLDLSDLFKPQIALEFGRYYLKELEDEFKHPLFVAYAYNGGPGFLRRTLKKKTLFLQGRDYEPWLSLELIPYEESKNYGPIVLANYIIYQELLGNSIILEDFLSQTLINKKEMK